MRDKPSKFLEQHRVTNGAMFSNSSFGNNGAFCLPSGLHVIASDGEGWDHVSVSREDRCPTWDEMCYVKELFFRGDEWVVQFHPPNDKNINMHPFCLHLWRPQNEAISRPPSWMVGRRGRFN